MGTVKTQCDQRCGRDDSRAGGAGTAEGLGVNTRQGGQLATKVSRVSALQDSEPDYLGGGARRMV